MLLLIVVACLLVAACTGDDGNGGPATYDPGAGEGESILPITLTEWLMPPNTPIVSGDPAGLTHLSISPMEPGENAITVELSDLDGEPIAAATSGATLTLQHRHLTPDGESGAIEMEASADRPATWRADALSLPDQGWYALEITLDQGDDIVGSTTAYVLLPDPSVHGSEAPDLPESDPDAEALYHRSLDAYASWETGQWREGLGSGTDVLVVSHHTVTSRPGEPPASEIHSRYSGAFRTRPDGTEPGPPRQNFSSRIVIGEDSWVRRDGGQWEAMAALEAATWEERADIYAGATNILPGGTEVIHGVETEIITFYLPQKGGQSEAWFIWWIDPDTADPIRMAMVARMHFMVWDFHDVNAPITIAPPSGSEPATPTTGG